MYSNVCAIFFTFFKSKITKNVPKIIFSFWDFWGVLGSFGLKKIFLNF